MTTTIITLASVLLAVAALFALGRQLRKELPISASSLLLGLGASLVFLAINLLLLRRAIRGLPEIIGFGLGAIFGLVWGQASRFRAEGGTVYVRRSALHLLFWGISLALTQALAWLAPSSWLVAGLATTALAAGTTVGISLNHLARYGLTARKARRATT
ncbi:MAG: hypothetical protein ACOX2R_02910 [Anaerolineae bacterium]